MKNLFNIILIISATAVAFLVFYFILGNPDNFVNGDFHEPKNALGYIYTGGPLVALLITFIILAIAYTIERFLSINKAKGKGNPEKFIKELIDLLAEGDLDKALALCDQQRGSIANVMRAAIVRFKEVEGDPQLNDAQKIGEVQRSIDESMNLETPLLEKNLPILSTVASISTMVGLLGTTVGMIRAFQALAADAAAAATQLAIGISEALYNTAGGLIGAVIAIVAYNFFTTKVDQFIYMMDEAILSVVQIFTVRVKK